MTQLEEFGKLDSQEARRAFRSRYDECIFKAAYSMTGSYHQAQQLKRALFAEVEEDFSSKPLPRTTELYLLSRLNMLYARGEWRQTIPPIGDISVSDTPEAWQPAQEPAERTASLADAVAQPESGPVVLGEVVYIPRERAARSVYAPRAEAPAAPVMRTQAAPAPQSLREEPPREENKAAAERNAAAWAGAAQTVEELRKEEHEAHTIETGIIQENGAAEGRSDEARSSSYDPELTAEWSPDMDEEQAPVPRQEKAGEQEAAPAGRQDEGEETPSERKSVSLTMVNCVLALVLIAAVIYLVLSALLP